MTRIIRDKENLDTVFTVKSIGDLLSTHTISAGNKIDAKAVTYLIDNNSLNMGIYSLSNAVSGVRFGLQGANKGVSSITSSQAGISLIESISQNLLISDLDISATGAGSEAIKMTGTGNEAIDLLNVSFSGSTNMGTLENLRQGFWTTGFSFGASSGFLLKGAWGGFRVTSSRFINLGGALLKGDVGFTIGNIRSDVNIDIISGQVAFDFDFDMITEDQGYQLENGRYSGLGNMVAPFTLGSGADTVNAWESKKSFFKGNKGNLAKNTNIGGAITFTTEQVVSLVGGVRTELLGNTTASNLVHMISTNRNLQHNTTSTGCYFPSIDITIDAPANREILLELVRTSDGVAVASKAKTVSNILGGADVVDFSFTRPCFELEDGDDVKLFATINITGNATIKNGSTVYLKT